MEENSVPAHKSCWLPIRHNHGQEVDGEALRGRLGKAHLFFLALLLHGGGLCVFLDV